MNIRLRILIPIFLTETLLVSVFLIHQAIQQKDHFRDSLQRTSQTFRALIEAEVQADINLMTTALSSLGGDPELQKLLKTKNVDALRTKVSPTYEHLKKRFQITHFYFHGVDRANLYRMHEPAHSGDMINRTTLKQAQETSKLSYGVEQGPTGASVLRVVLPVFSAGQLAGYVELGKEFQDISAKIHHLMGVEALVLAHKSKVNRKDWEKRNNKSDFSVSWDFFPDHVVMASSMPVIPADLGRIDLLGAGDLLSKSIDLGDRVFEPILIPFAGKSDVGQTQIVVLYDSSKLRSDSWKNVIITVTLCVFVLSALLVFYFVFLGRVENMVRRTESLTVERDAAARANQAKSEFLANISHELRTPMHGILSFARFGVQKSGTVPVEKTKSYFVDILESAERLMKLLNDLLDLSKMEAGKMEYAFETRDLIAVAEDVRSESFPLAKERNIAIEISAGTKPAACFMDSHRVAQVLRNLVSNAVKFADKGSVVRIAIENGNDKVTCKVIDRGLCIPAAELETVFDKFVQSTKTNTGAGGTGLGLSICKEIVGMHQGKIWAESSPGGETVFTFELPRQQAKSGPSELTAA